MLAPPLLDGHNVDTTLIGRNWLHSFTLRGHDRSQMEGARGCAD